MKMARKKTGKLPFVVQPRLEPIIETIGTEESGKFEIQRRGYLTVGEKAFTQASSNADDSVSGLFAIVQRIAKETGKSAEDVFSDIQGVSEDDYLDQYREELNEKMFAMTAYQERYKLISATSLIISRINPSWSAEDTMELHPDILDGLAELYEDEEKKSLEAFGAGKPSEEKEEEGGKP